MKLNTKQTILIGLSFASILAFWQFYDQAMPVILNNHFGLTNFATNFIMSIDNVLAIFMLPLFGTISDKVKSPMGKRTPFILFGTIAAVILMGFIAALTETKSFTGFMICLALLLLTMSVYRSPAVAYMPDVTPKPLRSKGNAIINLVGYIGGIYANIACFLLLKSDQTADGKLSYHSFLPVFAAVAVFMIVTVLIMVFTVNENKAVADSGVTDDDDRESDSSDKGKKLPKDVAVSLGFLLTSTFLWFCAYNGVTTCLSRYFEYKFMLDAGDSSAYVIVATISAIISFVPLGSISSRFGRKKTVMGGIILMTFCYAALIFVNKVSPVIYVFFAIVGIGWAAINVNSFPMVVDMCHCSDVGRFTGLYYAFSMAGQIVTPILSGFLIDSKVLNLGFDVLFPYAVVFSVLSFITMIFVRHGDSKPEKKASILENFDVDD